MKIFHLAAFMFVLSISVFVSPCSNAGEGMMTPAERDVARIAKRYVAARYPEFDTVKYPPVVHDKGDTWEVYYDLNPISGTGVIAIGGTPVVVIEKNTLTVLRSYHTQ